VLRSDCRDRRADLIVRTGDQAEESVSRHIAPYGRETVSIKWVASESSTYSLTANIWMPHLRVEFHDWRPEGVISGYLDIDNVIPSLIWCAWWTFEGAFQVCQVISVPHGTGEYV